MRHRILPPGLEALSTVIGNLAIHNEVGIVVACPSNVTDNTAVNSTIRNFVLVGNGCNNTDNLAL